MIREVQIKNFKSIQDLKLELGRVNVLIGENGCGKSNILEAIAFASAASQHKLDNEFLASRGIRVTEPRFMRAGFAGTQAPGTIDIVLQGDGERGNVRFECSLEADETAAYTRWVDRRQRQISLRDFEASLRLLEQGQGEPLPAAAAPAGPEYQALPEHRLKILNEYMRPLLSAQAASMELHLENFLIYSPENSALRVFLAEGQILPLGIRGEGLFAHLKALSTVDKERVGMIMNGLTLIDWFERFELPEGLAPGERSLRIRDRYLSEDALFDQRSANEGFLLLLFYFTLFLSPDTPRFFAVDNIDASLNPKLCRALLQVLVIFAEGYDRQVILTTHNPAILDGLNLHDEEQRLQVVYRGKDGSTRVRRVHAPKPLDGDPPVNLSEAFMRGYIGGLPKNF